MSDKFIFKPNNYLCRDKYHYNNNNGKKKKEILRTIGFHPETFSGIIAFILLFVGIALMIVNTDIAGYMNESSFFRVQFEFFKTAFLMMIAFYFGGYLLRFLLQCRLLVCRRSLNTAGGGELSEEEIVPEGAGGLAEDDGIFGKKDKSSGIKLNMITEGEEVLSDRSMISASEKPNGLIPIIDAGHGGIVNGRYTTAPKKMYQFEDDNYTVYEGVINREVGKKLMVILDKKKIPYHDLTVNINKDTPLKERTNKANELYSNNKNYYYLSIHSNTASATGKGKGTKATGFEIWTSVGQTKSDKLADIAGKWYKKLFPDFRFRQDLEDGDLDKESAFWVLRKTRCPAFLVENLFYDNRKEAEFLMSEEGQNRIAECLSEAINEIYNSNL
ncbi:MAG: N-acetylmuramoyl-L-alanine amidase [Bacteroidales bacterium]|nr:N-acetylmuramoyl-L-alanine amidase [Bacteroidales bacterium]